MAIQNLRESVADCQQENFYLKRVKIWNEMEKSLIQGRRLQRFPASQPIKYFISLWRVHFLAHTSICPIRLVKLRGTVDFQRPKRQYPDGPRPASTVYFYQSTGLRYEAAADPLSYNLFSGVIRSFCFITE